MSSSRILPLLRLLTVALAVGIVVLGGAVVRSIITGDKGVPRTEAERTVAAAEAGVQANPNDANARIKLASAYIEQGSASRAIEQGKIALRLKPNDPSAYYVLGLAESKAGQSAQAITDLKKAATTTGQLAPFYQDAYVALAHAQEAAGDSKAALLSMDGAISYGANNAPLLEERGRMYDRAGKWFDAAVDYAWALQYVPDLSDTRAALEKIKKEHPKDYNRAVLQVSRALGNDQPSQPTTNTPAAP